MKRTAFLFASLCSIICFLTVNSMVAPGGASGEEEVKNLRCWRCKKSFTVPPSQSKGKCPYCGAKYILPPPTPIPTPTPVPSPSPIPGSEPEYVSWQDGPRYLGQTVSVKGQIVGAHLSSRSGNLYLNFHADFKNTLSIKIEKQDIGKFPPDPASYYQRKTVIATGRIIKDRDYLRLIVTDPANLRVLK